MKHWEGEVLIRIDYDEDDYNVVADDFMDWVLDLPQHFDDVRYRPRSFRIIGATITQTPVEVTS
jgi:hypothetical protein